MGKRGWNLKDPAVIAARKAKQAAFYADEEKSKANSELISQKKQELFSDEEKSAETRKKMSVSATERALRTPEDVRKERMGEISDKAWSDPVSREKLMEARRRPQTFTPEQLEKRRVNSLGNKANTGRKFTEQHKARLRVSQAMVKRPFKDTKPEKIVRKYLDTTGIPYVDSYHLRGIRKQFDFYVPSLSLLIEVDGCYWHACPTHCPLDLNDKKIVRKVMADRRSEADLKVLYPELKLLRIWEHDLVGKDSKDLGPILGIEVKKS